MTVERVCAMGSKFELMERPISVEMTEPANSATQKAMRAPKPMSVPKRNSFAKIKKSPRTWEGIGVVSLILG